MPLVFPRWFANARHRHQSAPPSARLHDPRLGEVWRSYSSAGAERTNRQAFVRTIRTVIDPGGQTVSALDRLYLAGHVPTLIVWGELDGIIPVAHAHVAHDAIKGSRLVLLAGVGHFPHTEAPAPLLAALHDFLDTTEAATPRAPWSAEPDGTFRTRVSEKWPTFDRGRRAGGYGAVRGSRSSRTSRRR